MCATCGCSGIPSHDHGHHHDHDHHTAHAHDGGHPHVHAEPHGEVLRLERDVLEKNDRMATRNQGWLQGRGLIALNLVSSPGAGKTTLLERSIRDLHADVPIHVIEGDQATERDADRIRAAGARAVQVNTGTGCHLDAEMVWHALEVLDPDRGLVLIENVGNLVCPALFELGERAKVLVCSVTEGEDKPLKYPHMFRAASLVVLNKVDLLPHVSFDVAAFQADARAVNPDLAFLPVSATRGDGLDAWYAWLRSNLAAPARTTAP